MEFKKIVKKCFKLVGILIKGFLLFILVIATLGNYATYRYGKMRGKQDKLDMFTVRAKTRLQVEKRPTKINF